MTMEMAPSEQIQKAVDDISVLAEHDITIAEGITGIQLRAKDATLIQQFAPGSEHLLTRQELIAKEAHDLVTTAEITLPTFEGRSKEDIEALVVTRLGEEIIRSVADAADADVIEILKAQKAGVELELAQLKELIDPQTDFLITEYNATNLENADLRRQLDEANQKNKLSEERMAGKDELITGLRKRNRKLQAIEAMLAPIEATHALRAKGSAALRLVTSPFTRQ